MIQQTVDESFAVEIGVQSSFFPASQTLYYTLCKDRTDGLDDTWTSGNAGQQERWSFKPIPIQ